MKKNKNSISWVIFKNLTVLITFALSIYIMNAKLRVWYIALVVLVQCGLETLFFYKKSNNSFKPLDNGDILEITLKSTSITMAIFGSIILIAVITTKFLY